MRKMLILFFVCGLLLVSCVFGTTYYYDDLNGNDSNDGLSIGTARKNFELGMYGAYKLSNGDRLVLLNGTHNVSTNSGLSSVYTDLTDIVVEGESRDDVIVKINDSGITTKLFYIQGGNFTLRSMTLDENGFSIQSAIKNRIENAPILIDNVKAIDFTVFFEQYTANVGSDDVITNIILENVSNAIKLYGNVTFENVTAYNRYNGFRFYFENLENVNVTNVNSYYDVLIDNSKTMELYASGEFNHLNPERLMIENVDVNEFVLRDMVFNSSNRHNVDEAFILLDNVSDFVIDNISFCSSSNMCSNMTFISQFAPYLLHAKSGSNLTVKNSDFYTNDTGRVTHVWFDADQVNSVIDNNTGYHYGSDGSGFFASGNHSIISDNYFEYDNESVSYAIGSGTENSGHLPVNITFDNNYVKSIGMNNSYRNTHSFFFGYVHDSLMSNNVAIGGGFSFISKGCNNVRFENNTGYYPEYRGLIEKSGHNNFYVRNKYYADTINDELYNAYANPVDNMSVENSTHIEEEYHCVLGSTNCFDILATTKNVDFYDCDLYNYGWDNVSLVGNTTVNVSYSVLVEGDSGNVFNLVDVNNVSYGDYSVDNYSTSYFQSYFINSSELVDTSSYVLNVLLGGVTYSDNFSLVASTLLNTNSLIAGVGSGGGSAGYFASIVNDDDVILSDDVRTFNFSLVYSVVGIVLTIIFGFFINSLFNNDRRKTIRKRRLLKFIIFLVFIQLLFFLFKFFF